MKKSKRLRVKQTRRKGSFLLQTSFRWRPNIFDHEFLVDIERRLDKIGERYIMICRSHPMHRSLEVIKPIRIRRDHTKTLCGIDVQLDVDDDTMIWDHGHRLFHEIADMLDLLFDHYMAHPTESHREIDSGPKIDPYLQHQARALARGDKLEDGVKII